MQKSSDSFITYTARPKKKYVSQKKELFPNKLPLLAIVLQGPVKTEDDFTIETIELYKQNFPQAIIILSTWKDDEKNIDSLDISDNIHLLFHEKPNYYGISNTNLQILSSKEGVLKAKNLGAEYVIKTRTDQRFYSTSVDQYLFNIINNFPLKSTVKTQKQRLIGLSLNTFKYRMYGLSDMFLYGHIDDVLLYWNIPLDERIFEPKDISDGGVSPRTHAELCIGEVYFASNFLKKINESLKWNLQDSWNMFANHFCVIDAQSLDLFWGKYTAKENRWKKYNKSINVFEELEFSDWYNLYNNTDRIKPDESILDLPLHS